MNDYELEVRRKAKNYLDAELKFWKVDSNCSEYSELEDVVKAFEVGNIGKHDYFLAGLAQVGQGNYEDAVKLFQEALSDDKDVYDKMVLRNISACYWLLGDDIRAIDYDARANPGNYDLSDSVLSEKKLIPRIQDLEGILAEKKIANMLDAGSLMKEFNDEHSAEAYDIMGVANLAFAYFLGLNGGDMGAIDSHVVKALNYFNSAFNSSDDGELFYKMAYCYFLIGETEQAERYFGKYMVRLMSDSEKRAADITEEYKILRTIQEADSEGMGDLEEESEIDRTVRETIKPTSDEEVFDRYIHAAGRKSRSEEELDEYVKKMFEGEQRKFREAVEPSVQEDQRRDLGITRSALGIFDYKSLSYDDQLNGLLDDLAKAETEQEKQEIIAKLKKLNEQQA